LVKCAATAMNSKLIAGQFFFKFFIEQQNHKVMELSFTNDLQLIHLWHLLLKLPPFLFLLVILVEPFWISSLFLIDSGNFPTWVFFFCKVAKIMQP
jgi:hypothetical protein